MTKSWIVNYPFFVDLLSIQSKKNKPTIHHPLTYLFQHIKTKIIPFSPIPTTGLWRNSNYNKAVAEIISKYNSNVCIRLFDDDMINIEDLENEINDLLSTLNVFRTNAHLLLDFRAITDKNMFDVAATTINIINNLSGIEKWKTLTLAASSIPEIVGKKNEVVRIPRVEFSLWKHIISNSKSLSRIPSYGDYGIVHPNNKNLNMTAISVSFPIRLTVLN